MSAAPRAMVPRGSCPLCRTPPPRPSIYAKAQRLPLPPQRGRTEGSTDAIGSSFLYPHNNPP